MEQEIFNLLNSKDWRDYKLGLNLITEESIKFLDPDTLYKMIRIKKPNIDYDIEEIFRLKRVFSVVGYHFKITDFL